MSNIQYRMSNDEGSPVGAVSTATIAEAGSLSRTKTADLEARDLIEHNKKAYVAKDFPNATGSTQRPPETLPQKQ